MMRRMTIPVFVINRDRRPDRMQFMSSQLEAMGILWHRVSAIEPETVDQARLSREVLVDNQTFFGPGSQCCGLTNFDIYRRIVAQNLPAALVLQDDVNLSPDIRPFLETLDWLPGSINLVQFEKYGRKASHRLLSPAVGTPPVADRTLHRLYSRTAGAACYLITQDGASCIMRNEPVLNMPIDHFLFSPNLSPLFDQLNVAVLRPALARQLTHEESHSDIEPDRIRSAKSIRGKLRRLYQETNRTPTQLSAMARGARWLDYTYKL
jgi:glycosyl transferase, family 25